MNEKEALQSIGKLTKHLDNSNDYLVDTFKTVCEALYAVQRYRQIGTVEECKTAVKQFKSPWHKAAEGDLPQGPYSPKRKFYCKERDYGCRILLYDDNGFYYYNSPSLDIGIDEAQISAWMELPEYEEEQP